MFCRTTLVWTMLLATSCLCSSSVQAQFFFESDAVFMTRDNDGGAPFISGPNSLSSGSGSYGVEPGYRLSFGWAGEKYQVDTTFTQLNPWTSSSGSLYGGPIYFDGAGAGQNELVFPGFLQTAALSSLQGADESNEREFVTGGGMGTKSRSNYRDFEINVGTSQIQRPWRFSFGYRNIQLDEKNVMGFDGQLGVTTLPGSGSPYNSGLSNEALINAGATLIAGNGDGFTAGSPPTFLTYQINGDALNELNGAQAVFAYRFVERSWFSLEGTGKAGIYRNQITGRVVETLVGSGNDNSVYQRAFKAQDTGAAFAGNLGLKATVGITDYIDFVIGYEILFLSGVGLGSNQIAGLSPTVTGGSAYNVQHDGSLIANGGTIGFRVYW